jgi:small subunit ribosomal protein S21
VLFGGFVFTGFVSTGNRVSRTRRTEMGVRIVVADREPIRLALRRFKKLLKRNNLLGESRRREYFIKPTQTRRRKRFKKKFKARLATLHAKQAGQLPVTSVAKAAKIFWAKTGKP